MPELIIIVFIALALVFIVHKMIQEAFDILHIGISIFGILIAILFLAVAFDAVSFRMNLGKSENLVVFHEAGKVVSAEVVKEISSRPLPESEIKNLSRFIAEKDYKQALGTRYKLILVKNGVKNAGPSELMAAISNPLSIISDIKKGDIYVYPETLTFRIIRYIPGPEYLGFFRSGYDRILSLAGKNET